MDAHDTGMSSLLNDLPPRPLSEIGYQSVTTRDQAMSDLGSDTVYAQDDIDMTDASSSTAPSGHYSNGPTTWFTESED